MPEKTWAKILRIVGIILLGLTAAFTLMGGAGTTCVALDPTGFGGNYAGIAPFQWLYILFVLTTIGIGVLGVRAVVLLLRGYKGAYRSALMTLIAGVIVGGIHMITSRLLRGGSMPVDMVVYMTSLTLAVFILFRIPVIWQGINFEMPSGGEIPSRIAAAIVLVSAGMLTLTIQFIMAPTHTVLEINYADAWNGSLSLLGAALILAGFAAGVSKRAACFFRFHASRLG